LCAYVAIFSRNESRRFAFFFATDGLGSLVVHLWWTWTGVWLACERSRHKNIKRTFFTSPVFFLLLSSRPAHTPNFFYRCTWLVFLLRRDRPRDRAKNLWCGWRVVCRNQGVAARTDFVLALRGNF
jgi:hypothetical protein